MTVAGEITPQAKIDYEKVVRGVVVVMGFDSDVDDLSSRQQGLVQHDTRGAYAHHQQETGHHVWLCQRRD